MIPSAFELISHTTSNASPQTIGSPCFFASYVHKLSSIHTFQMKFLEGINNFIMSWRSGLGVSLGGPSITAYSEFEFHVLQVRNLTSSIKVAVDFLSPENALACLRQTQVFFLIL